jgi:hypothetical protein
MLLRIHGKNAIECESILLWTRTRRRRLELNGLQVVVKGNHDIATFSQF